MAKTVRNIYYNQDTVASLVPAVRNADANGIGVDLRDFDGNLIVASVGVEGITLSGANRIELKVEESDDNTTFTAVANSDLLGFVAGGVATGTFAIVDDNAEAPAIYSAQYIGAKQYIRVVLDIVGTHATGTPIAANVHRGFPHMAPVR